MKTLLQGMPYVPACATDIRKLFERVRKEQAAENAAVGKQLRKVVPMAQRKGK